MHNKKAFLKKRVEEKRCREDKASQN